MKHHLGVAKDRVVPDPPPKYSRLAVDHNPFKCGATIGVAHAPSELPHARGVCEPLDTKSFGPASSRIFYELLGGWLELVVDGRNEHFGLTFLGESSQVALKASGSSILHDFVSFFIASTNSSAES